MVRMERTRLASWVADGLSLEQIGREVGRHPSTVAYWLAKHGLSAPGAAKHAPRGPIDREELTALVEDGASVREIAERLARGTNSVRYWLKRYRLETLATERRRQAVEAPGETVQMRCRNHGVTSFRRSTNGSYRCLACRAEAVTRRRRKVKTILAAEAGGRCAICGYDRYVGALQFHHVDPSNKRFELSAAGFARSLERARAEAGKCVLLCSNCHAEVESGCVRLPGGQPHSSSSQSGVAQLADALDC